jgi:ankyrin repeat protein
MVTHGYESERVARLLLKNGADPTAQDDTKRTPLHAAMAFCFGAVSLIRVLLEHGADATAQDEDERTPLHCLCASSSPFRETVVVAELLLEYGADPTAQDKHQQTPSQLALNANNTSLAQFLLERTTGTRVQDNGDQAVIRAPSVNGCHGVTASGTQLSLEDEAEAE